VTDRKKKSERERDGGEGKTLLGRKRNPEIWGKAEKNRG